MNIIYLSLTKNDHWESAEDFIMEYPENHKKYIRFCEQFPVQISHLQRAQFRENMTRQQINYSFIKDRLPAQLRWWQEPVQLFDQVEILKPDIIEMNGLNLPLQFRLLRRRVGPKVLLIGKHCGEDFWPNQKIWLQQFGLRSVNGFIFFDEQVQSAWMKASVILKKQGILLLRPDSRDLDREIRLIYDFYSDLVAK